jgi:hypothetical protein
MGGYTNKITEGLLGFTGEGSLLNRVEDRLVPVKTEERADINCNTKQDSKGNGPSEGFAGSAIQNKTDVLKTQEPAGCRAARSVHGDIGEALGGLVTPFHRVLMLPVGLTSPLSDAQRSEYIQDAGAANKNRVITEQASRSTTFANNIFQRSDKLLVRLHAVDIHDVGLLTAIDGGGSRAIIDSWRVGIDNVREEVLVTPGNVESRVWGPVVATKDIAHGYTGILGGALQSPLDHFGG